MSRLVLVSGLCLAIFLLFQFHSGTIQTQDVLNMVISDDTSEPPELPESLFLDDDEVSDGRTADDYFEKFIFEKENIDQVFMSLENAGSYDSHVYGAILSPDLEQAESIAEFFARLKSTQDVETFVVIGENHTRRGKYNIASADYGFVTPYGNLEPDFDLLENLAVPFSYRAIFEEESVNYFVPFLKKEFPDARIVPIVIKHFANDDEIDALVVNLSDYLDENTVVIASSEFSENMTYLTAQFHNELSRNIIETLDKSAVGQVDMDSQPTMKVLLSYLDEKEAESSIIHDEIVEGGNSHFFATFHEGEPSQDRNLTIMAFGDMMLGRYVRTLMNANTNDYIFDNIKGYENRFFKGADFIFGNLEGPIKGEGVSGGTAMRFMFNTDIAPLLKKYGFNLFTITNNHALDYGWEGRNSTILTLEENGIGWCGHPTDTDPESVYYGKVGDKNVAFLCFQDVSSKLDDAAAVELIKKIRPGVDYLIVTIHWGYEYKQRADWNSQISPGHDFIDAGADIIIGHHPHVVQNFEIYNGKLIFYSLGNFIFDQYWSEMTQEELAIGIALDDSEENLKTKVYLFPMKSVMSQPYLLNEEEYKSWAEEYILYGEYSEEVIQQISNGVIEI